MSGEQPRINPRHEWLYKRPVLKKPDLQRFAAAAVDVEQQKRDELRRQRLLADVKPGFFAKLYASNPKKFMFCAGFGWMGFLLHTPLYMSFVQPVVDLCSEFGEWATRDRSATD